jgi:hypothetical protein
MFLLVLFSLILTTAPPSHAIPISSDIISTDTTTAQHLTVREVGVTPATQVGGNRGSSGGGGRGGRGGRNNNNAVQAKIKRLLKKIKKYCDENSDDCEGDPPEPKESVLEHVEGESKRPKKESKKKKKRPDPDDPDDDCKVKDMVKDVNEVWCCDDDLGGENHDICFT